MKRPARAFGAVLLLPFLMYFGTSWYLKSMSNQFALKSEKFLAARDTASARENLKWLLWFHPNDPQGLLISGKIEFADGSIENAIECFRGVPLESPFHEQAGFAWAQALAMDGQLTKAEDQLKRHFEQHAPSEEAWNLYFRLLYLQLRIRDASKLLEKKLAANPNDLSDLRHLLKADFVPQEPLESLPTLEEIHRKHPEDLNGQFALAMCRIRTGETSRAEQLLRSVLNQNPVSPRARIVLARLLIERHNFTSARKILWGKNETASSMDDSERLKRDDRFWSLSSRLAEEHADINAALQYMDRALEIKHNDQKHLSRRAQLLRRMSRKAEAAEVTRMLIEVGRTEQELFSMATQMQNGRISAADCKKIAMLYRKLGRTTRADAWDRFRDQVNQKKNWQPQFQKQQQEF